MPARGRLRATLLGCAIAAVLLGTGAVAQEAETPTGSTFEEVIVTAQRREQSIYDVPVALSAFTPETIERQGIQDLTDIGKFVPNLNVTEFSAGHTSSANPFIRGIGLQDHLITTEPGVGVYVDGVYLGRQVGQNWSLANIERVEVLRGPQGTLYGRNSIGGAINIITRKPGDEGGKVSLMAGSRERLNVDAYVNKRVSDEFAISITGAYHQRDGLGDFLNVPNASKRVGELQDISARIALQWNASDQLSFLVTADGNKGDNGLRPYDTLIDEIPGGLMFQAGYRNADGAADPYDNNTGQVNQVNVTNKAYGVSLTVGYAVSDALNFKLLASGIRSTRADSMTTASSTTSCHSPRSALPISSRWSFRSRARVARSTTWSVSFTTRRKDRTSRTVRASPAARRLRRARPLVAAATSFFTRSTTARRSMPMSDFT
jgi:iron complex outermembrane receptor protein